jgi:pectate lyase
MSSERWLHACSMEGVVEKSSRRMVSECAAGASGNLIDECWRCDPEWRRNRQALADCAVGAGRHAIGGRDGGIYVVTDSSDVDAANPVPGTLRYGGIQQGPLWIVFSRDMTIRLREELILNSFKTIDGRGCNVHIAGGAGLTLQSISNVILHGVHIHDVVPTGPATIRSSPAHSGGRGRTDGDAVNIYSSHDVWVDHCYFANGADGLVDVTMGSTGVTISNNYFTQHDKVILLGAHPRDTIDTQMRVTVAFNHFGPGLIERLPRYSSWCPSSVTCLAHPFFS